MTALQKLFRITSLLIGGLILLALILAIFAFLGRYLMISVSGPVTDSTHLQAKEAYLSSMPAASADAPNVVIIFFDDLGWGDLSSYGNQLIETPSIDAIASEGLLMTDFYSASPVCTPSRAALLTGRFPPRTLTNRHVYFPDGSFMGTGRRMFGLANALPREEITLAEVLQNAGYRTGIIGKWHLGEHEGHRPNDFGFDEFYGVLFSNDMYPLDMYRNEEVIIKDQREGGFFSSERDEMKPIPGSGIDQRQLTELYTDEAIAFLEGVGEKPFFLYVAHSFPHVPLYPSEAHANTSQGGIYGDVVEDLDRSTGAIVNALERLDLAENTLVVITSDNGADYNGSPGALRGRKGETLEGGQRVPMVVRWPAHQDQGRVSDAMAMNTDLFPTILSAAGLPLPQDRVIDGRDLTPLFKQQADSPHDYLYYFPNWGEVPEAIRSDSYKLTSETGNLGRDRAHLSLLDTDAEAHDVQNLFPEEMSALQQALSAKQREVRENPRGWQ